MYKFKLGIAIITAASVWGGIVDYTRAIEGPRPQSQLKRTEFAPRFTGGPIRVLFVGPYGAQQDAFELMQRFDIDGTVVPLSDHNDVKEFGIDSIYWPDLAKRPEQVLGELREALKTDWQVLVMDVFPQWPFYPEDVRETVLAAVAEGRSLLAANWEGPIEELAARGVSIEELDDKPVGFTLLHRCGKGLIGTRDVKIDHRFGYLFSQASSRSDFERSAAEVGRLLHHLAGPNATLCLRGMAFEAGRITVRMREDSPRSLRTVHLAVSRCDDNRIVFEAQGRVRPADVKAWSLPFLPTGAYQARAVVDDRQGTALDWLVERFEIQNDAAIASFDASPDPVKPGATVTCRMNIEGEIDGLTMRIRWYDAWQRLLLDQSMPDVCEAFELEAPGTSLSVLNYLEVALVSARGVEVMTTREIRMPAPQPAHDFYVLYWNTGVGTTWRQQIQYDALRRLGMADGFANCGVGAGQARSAAVSKLRTIPYATAFHNITLADHLFNEKWLDETEARARGAARAHGPYGSMAYTLGDENYVSAFKPEGRFSNDPAVWNLFQEYLRHQFVGIDKLNEQCGTTFGTWEDVHFDSEMEMLANKDNPSLWTAYRMFVSQHFAQAMRRMRRAIREEHPGAIVGWDGAEQYSSYDGYDWWQLTREMDLVQVYALYFVPGLYTAKIFNGEAVQSFRPDAKLKGAWLNAVDRHYGGDFATWYLALHGWNSVWWWHSSFLSPSEGALQWDLTPSPVVASMAAAAGEIRQGPATLLANSVREVDPIAVYYSENNFHASTIESGMGNHVNNLGQRDAFWMTPNLGGRAAAGDESTRALWKGTEPAGHYALAVKSFYLLLHDLGFQPITLARQQIEAGALSDGSFKVLVLPFVVSLSDREAERIEDFVESGGLVIADYRCGRRDLYGRVRPEPALQKIFGLEASGGSLRRGREDISVELKTGLSCRYETTFHEPVSNFSGKAYGWHDDGSAAWILHPHGRGSALYLNSDIYDYENMRRTGSEHDLRDLLGRILRTQTGLAPAVVVEHRNGHAIGHTTVTRFTSGGARYWGILPDFHIHDKRPAPARITFPVSAELYDVRAGLHLGRGRTWKGVIEPGKALLFAGLPYAVSGVEADAPSRIMRGRPLTISIRVRPEGEIVKESVDHAVRAVVYGPDKQEVGYLSRTLHLPRGRGDFVFTPALNAEAGQWTVHLTECVSGKRNVLSVQVR